MELVWLETFLAVVDRGGFTAASEQVHRSQSRVSAHIAGLERELGVQLIDRSRRPARLTAAGRIFTRHARDIVAGVGSARSALDALAAMDRELLRVLTTPCIGAALLPGVVAELAARHPGFRVAVTEQGCPDLERRFPAEGGVVAVLPTLPHPLAPGLQERLLWREPLRLVVPDGHVLAVEGGPVAPQRLVEHRLVVCGPPAEGLPPEDAESEPHAEVLTLLAARGVEVLPRAFVDTPQTLVAMCRAGVGIGVANAVALAHLDTTGLQVLDFDDPDMVREVAAYWYAILASTEVGSGLLRSVLAAPVPPGAVAAPRPAGSGCAPGGSHNHRAGVPRR